MPSRQIIWHRILMICNVGHPIITVHIRNVEDIESIHSQPDISERTTHACIDMAVFVLEQTVADADVHTAITCHTEHLFLTTGVGWAKGKSTGIMSLQSQPKFSSWSVGRGTYLLPLIFSSVFMMPTLSHESVLGTNSP